MVLVLKLFIKYQRMHRIGTENLY